MIGPRFLAPIAVVLVTLAGVPCAALADATRDASRQFHRGLELFRRSRYEDARDAFEQAYRILPNPRVLANIAACLARLGHSAEAVRTYRKYLAEGGTQVEADARSAAEREIERLRRSVGQIVVAAEPAGAEVLIDGTPVGVVPLPGPIAVDPGRRTVEVHAEGWLPFSRVVEARAGEDHEVRVVLGAPAAPAPTRTVRAPAAPDGDTRWREAPSTPGAAASGSGPWPWVSVGAALALGVAAGTTGLLALSGQREYEDPATSIERRRELYGPTNTLAIATDVLLGSAAVAVTVAVILWATGGNGETDGEAEATATIERALGWRLEL